MHVGYARRTVLIRRGNMRPGDRVHLLNPTSRYQHAWCASARIASPRPGTVDEVTCRECLSTWKTATGG